MILKRTYGVGGLVMLLVLALAALGIGIALWSKVLTIKGTVVTGDVDAVFVGVFTDDDDAIDNPLKDGNDSPFLSGPPIPPGQTCPVHVGPDKSPFGNDKDPDDGLTSCDPARTGRDPKPRYDKDVARCDATTDTADREHALVQITNGYPSYHCTAWFDLLNTGTIPILLHGVLINGAVVAPCESGASTKLDLDGDGVADIEICVSELFLQDAAGNLREEQCDPRPPGVPQEPDECQFDLDIHVLQEARQNATYTFLAEVCVHQWNEEPPAGGGFCGPNPEHALPDLVTKFLDFSETAATCTITYEVSNIGGTPAGASTTKVTAGGHPDGFEPTPALAAGASVVLSTTLVGGGDGFGCVFDPNLEGDLTADSGGVVAESDETNNTTSYLVLG